MHSKHFAIYDVAGNSWLASLKISALYNSVAGIFFFILTNDC